LSTDDDLDKRIWAIGPPHQKFRPSNDNRRADDANGVLKH
jgi:hypothetical protein